jgi:hypothetical protein
MVDILNSLLPVIRTDKITLTSDTSGLINLNVKMYSVDTGFDEIDPAINTYRPPTTNIGFYDIEAAPGDSFGIMQSMKIALIVTLSREAKNVTEGHLQTSEFSVNMFDGLDALPGLNGMIHAFSLPARQTKNLLFNIGQNSIDIPVSDEGEVVRQNSGTDITTRHLINFSIAELPANLEYLHIKAFCYVDRSMLFSVFPELGLIGFPESSDSITESGQYLIDTIRGPGVEDLVIVDGAVNPSSFILTRQDGTQYTGAYHYHQPSNSYMEGSFHTDSPHEILTKVQVRNDKVQDFRKRARIEPNPYNFNNLNSFLDAFDSIANQAFKDIREKIRLRQRTSDSYELNNTSIETDLSVDNLVTGQIKIDQVEIMREHSSLGFLFDGLLPIQKLYSLWWRDMFRLVDAKLVRRRLSNNLIGHDRLGLPDRKLFDSNQIEEVVTNDGEAYTTAISAILEPNFFDIQEFYDPDSLLDTSKLNQRAISEARQAEQTALLAEKQLKLSEADFETAKSEFKIAEKRLALARRNGNPQEVRKLKAQYLEKQDSVSNIRSGLQALRDNVQSSNSLLSKLRRSLPSGMIKDQNWITEGNERYRGLIRDLPVYAPDPNDPSEILFPWVRNLVFEDYTFQRNKNLTGVYQYGIELTYEDGLVKYVYEVVDNLMKNQLVLNEIAVAMKNKFNYVGVGNTGIDEAARFKPEFLDYVNDKYADITKMIVAYADAFALSLSATATNDFDTLVRYLDRFTGREITASGEGMGRSPVEQAVINYFYAYIGRPFGSTAEPNALLQEHIRYISDSVFNPNNGAMSPANLENFFVFQKHYDLLIKNLLELTDLSTNAASSANTFTKSSNSGRTPSLIRVKKFFKEVSGGDSPQVAMDTEGIVDLTIPTKVRSSVLPGVSNPFLDGYTAGALIDVQDKEIQKFGFDTSGENMTNLNEENAYFTPFEFFGSSMFTFGDKIDSSFSLNIRSQTKKVFLLDAVIQNKSFSRSEFEGIHSLTDEEVDKKSIEIIEKTENTSGVFSIVSNTSGDLTTSTRYIVDEREKCEILGRDSIDALIDAQRAQESQERLDRLNDIKAQLASVLTPALRIGEGVAGSPSPEDNSVSKPNLGSMRMFTIESLQEAPDKETIDLPWQLQTAIDRKQEMLGVSERGRLSTSLFGNMVSIQKQVGFKKDEFGTPKLDKPMFKTVTVGEIRSGLKPGKYKTTPFENTRIGIANNHKVSNVGTSFKIKASPTNKTSITGGAGADTITGGAGADTITGGAGADTITGGAGADTRGIDIDQVTPRQGELTTTSIQLRPSSNINRFRRSRIGNRTNY